MLSNWTKSRAALAPDAAKEAKWPEPHHGLCKFDSVVERHRGYFAKSADDRESTKDERNALIQRIAGAAFPTKRITRYKGAIVTDTTHNIPDEALAQVTGGTAGVPPEFKKLLDNVKNPDVKRKINQELNKGAIGNAYRHLYQALRLDGLKDLAMQVKQLYADTHEGSGIPGLL